MMKLKNTMKKLLFILFTLFSISCQINKNSNEELEKIWLTDVSQAIEKSKYVDYLLLDSGKPSEEIKKLGGTGETHNWEISRAVVKDSNIPVFLAGGLNKNNIIEAINFVRPYGIDLCSGVRTNDALDKNKLIQFMNFVRNK